MRWLPFKSNYPLNPKPQSLNRLSSKVGTHVDMLGAHKMAILDKVDRRIHELWPGLCRSLVLGFEASLNAHLGSRLTS